MSAPAGHPRKHPTALMTAGKASRLLVKPYLHGPECRAVRCTEAAQYGYLCERHLDEIQGLAIKPSRIKGAGMGLFTTIARADGEILVAYEGEESDSPIPDSEYTFKSQQTKFIDASDPNCGAGRYANTARNTPGFSNNAKINQNALIVATRAIGPDEEILVPYGRSYSIASTKAGQHARSMSSGGGEAQAQTKVAINLWR
jgi:hypothetical protein